MASLLEKIFGSYSDRELKKIAPIVNEILALDEQMQNLSDEELKSKTMEFKNRYENGESLDQILPEAYAVVREASDRVLGMKHFPVQIYGGIILHHGRIAEMKTGEGKTLVATLPSYLNALTGKGVHIITVNDYLAKRDKEWMGKVHEFLGLTVGCIIHGIKNKERREAYHCDITYGTNNEFGFDYLRDNMVIHKDDMVQRNLYYGIVDEVDSILVDEARTPLIISGKGDESTKLYSMANSFTLGLTSRKIDPNEPKNDLFNREIKDETVDFLIDEKAKKTSLTDKGIEKAEKFFGVENFADVESLEIAHHINQALKARSIMKRDIDYVVKDGEVLIVDEFTGRLMEGRRYSDGLHQAIEAKENLNIRSESKTLATITFQNYFRMYDKLSGMTGTAKTEEEEFREIYNMDVVEITTNEPVIREDLADSIYRNEEAKFRAVVRDIKERNAKGQPILVGTITIENSEKLSKYLKKERIPHEVLNAKYHEREAEIVAQAGRLGSVTIATNMAGRGTDIVLGGNPEYLANKEMKAKGYSDEIIAMLDDFTAEETDEFLEAKEKYNELVKKYKEVTDKEHKEVIEAGGLHIVGTERHESRRIDNQLRGRSGRQGDPGSSKFYISLEDDLMRLFAGDRFKSIVETMKMPEDEPLEHSMLTKTIENAQKKVEGNNFAIRKHVLQYDDVMNKQREVIYAQRRDVLNGVDLKENIRENTINIIEENIGIYTGGNDNTSEWDMEGLNNFLMKQFGIDTEIFQNTDISTMNKDSLENLIKEKTEEKYREREETLGERNFREAERVILLQVVDRKWMDHIDAMDQLRQGIGLRAYGQEDPVRAYQIEGYDMFEQMSHDIWEETVGFLFNIEKADNVQRKQVAKPTTTNRSESQAKSTVVRKGRKIGRNEPCPCGSGKKYKKCCGANI